MPFTPYHFGPSGFIGLLCSRRLDLPVLVLANVVVDIEVPLLSLFDLGYPAHRYAHTLLLGAAVGMLWGLLAWPLRRWLARLMAMVHLPYAPNLRRMLLSGVLGVWLHVLIDGLYHPGVRILWPFHDFALWRLTYLDFPRERVKDISVLLFLAAIVLYLVRTAGRRRRSTAREAGGDY